MDSLRLVEKEDHRSIALSAGGQGARGAGANARRLRRDPTEEAHSFDLEVFLDNLAIAGRNIGDSNQVTLEQLPGFAEPVAEEDEALDLVGLPE